MKNKYKTNLEKESHIITNGVVTENLPGTKFLVKLNDIDTTVKCTLAGKLRMNKITIVEGDSVEVKLSPYDPTSGIISWRF